MDRFIFFVGHKRKPVCFICNESICVNTEYILKWHRKTKHKSDSKYTPSEGEEKLEKLKANLDRQTIFKKQSTETERTLKLVRLLVT